MMGSVVAAALVWATAPVASKDAAEAAANRTIREFMDFPWYGRARGRGVGDPYHC